jgi:hypothetical protein
VEVPPIQSLVINNSTRLPGEGFDQFLKEKGYESLSVVDRRRVLDGYWHQIRAFPFWDELLISLGLRPADSWSADLPAEILQAPRGGESEAHRLLKHYVARNPRVVGLARSVPQGVVEYRLASGDSVDVVFEDGKRFIAVEVKPSSSSEGDVARGLFQCLKYRVVAEANIRYLGRRQAAQSVLVLGGSLPDQLVPLRNCLGIKVVERVASPLTVRRGKESPPASGKSARAERAPTVLAASSHAADMKRQARLKTLPLENGAVGDHHEGPADEKVRQGKAARMDRRA